MKTPDITPEQISAKLTLIVGQFVAWGYIGNHTGQLVVSIGSVVLACVLMIADAWIRHGRSKAAAVRALEELLLERTMKPSSSG
jgi:cytochrome c biogenesis protein ResB